MNQNEATARQAELALLAGLMLATKIEPGTFEALSLAAFADSRHATIWTAIGDEIRSGEPDAPSLAIVDRLTADGKLDEAGGFEYVQSFPSWAFNRRLGDVGKNLSIVKRCASMRRIGLAADAAAKAAAGEGRSARVALATLKNALDEAEETEQSKSTTAFDALIFGLDDAFGDPVLTKTPIDQKMPLVRGRMFVIGGRPGHGKTTLSLQLAACILKADPTAQVLVASCEMGEPELAVKVISAIDGRDYATSIRRGGDDPLTPVKLAATEEHGVLCRLHLRSTRSMDAVISEAHRIHRERGLTCVLIDYISAFDAPGGAKFDTRTREVGAVSRACKTLAQNLDCVVIAASQLNRASKDSAAPTLRGLRDSGEIEQDADGVLLLHRPDHDSEIEDEQAQLLVAKNRWGELGSIPMSPDLANHRFLWMSSRK